MAIIAFILTLGIVAFSLAVIRIPQRRRVFAAPAPVAHASGTPHSPARRATDKPQAPATAANRERLAHDIETLRHSMREHSVRQPAAEWPATDFAETQPLVIGPTRRPRLVVDAGGEATMQWNGPERREDLRIILNL